MKNPEQIKETWLNRIENGKSKEIARAFFYTYTTQEVITKILYPKAYVIRKKKNKKNFVMPLITSRVKEWKGYNFFDKSIPLKKQVLRNGRTHQQTFFLSLMNLEPIYRFCKEYKNIEFNEEEKKYLQFLLINGEYRKLILEEYPEESIIQAVLKFYAKNCINKYLFYLRDIRENTEKYKKQIEKAKELNNPTTKEGIFMKNWGEKMSKEIYEKYRKPIGLKHRINEFDVIQIITMENLLIKSLPKEENESWNEHFNKIPSLRLNQLFSEYLHEISKDKELVKSVDNKILKALNLLPSI